MENCDHLINVSYDPSKVAPRSAIGTSVSET